MEISRLSPHLGAEIGGIDLANLDDATFASLDAVWLEHLVIHIPGLSALPKR